MEEYWKYKKGSEWRKWDLHIHAPFTKLNNQYSDGDANQQWNLFCKKIEESDVSVFGVTDYFSVDNYFAFNKKFKEKYPDSKKILFPNIEFRLDSKNSKEEHIQLHIIFNNQQTALDKLDNFLTRLKLVSTDNINLTNKYCTKDNLDEIGYKKAMIKLDSLYKLLKNDFSKDEYLIIGVANGYGSLRPNGQNDSRGSEYAKELDKISDIFFGNSKNTNFFLNIITGREQYSLAPKPVLTGCDAHSFNDLNNKLGKVYKRKNNNGQMSDSSEITWIKADPTFEGLKQIIYEPEERVFIGETPELLERVKSNKTKFIKSVSITQVQGCTEDKGIWFKNVNIPLNYGMVSIIGNKGNGKSALADIIGLCGNSHHYKDFSFLNKDRFLKNGLAKNFNANLKWANNEIISKNLYDEVDCNAPERVRYLPQSFFDKLTNNLDNYDFKKTLEDIVFSYLPEEEKLGKNSFEDLIKYKEESINKDIEIIVNEVNSIDDKLIEFENKTHPTYKDKLEKELEIKKKELEEHLKNKPQEVKNPDSDENTKEQNKEISKQLSEKNNYQEELEAKIVEKQKIKVSLKQKIEDLSNIKQDIVRLESKIEFFKSTNQEKLKNYQLDIDNIFKYEIDLSEIKKILSKQDKEYGEILEELLSEEQITTNYSKEKHKKLRENSLILKLSQLKIDIKKLKGELSAPYRKYQDYLEKLKKWEKYKFDIEGNENISQTIKWYVYQIKYVKEELPKIIKEQREVRINKSIEILNKKLELVNVYNKLKKSVDIKITAYKSILKDYDINIDVALKLNLKFGDNFLSYINQNRNGSFYQKDQGKTRIDKIIENINFQNADKLEQFLKEIVGSLEIDKREEHKDAIRYISEQINTENLLAFYNYLFSINYLEPSYELKLGDKHITELSPGEKGAMLIVFYLMLDKDNIPLIIDQPEENLDNESIYKILVHFIKDTKRKRQVILVTHNPNLAIVGDSEQIIYVNIDKKNKNRFNFESGAIENYIINRYASKILEGTIKAFDIRRLKYLKV